MNCLRTIIALIAFCSWGCPVISLAGVEPEYLYPDLFPYVEEDAQGSFATLQNWQLSGNQIRFNTLFANQGDGVFEIRPGNSINEDRYELLQRVYIGNDYVSGGPNTFEDINIGDAPKPNSPDVIDAPVGGSNLIWFENFTRFSLHEAVVLDGALAVGNEVAGDTKMSWRLSPNTGPLPSYSGFPSNGSSNQAQQQRIGVGWADLYGAGSFGQFVDITGVEFGPLYWLRQTVDPENRITETDETNNSYEVLIDLNNPSFAFRRGPNVGSFLQPGDARPGDLNGDGEVDVEDWNAFRASATTDLSGLGEEDALMLGDLNLDGRHSLADAALFREYYELVNGVGSFGAISSRVPEPASVFIAGAAALAVCYVGRRQLHRARRVLLVALTISTFLVGSSPQQVLAELTIWTEDFEGVTLGPTVDEGNPSTSDQGVANSTAWTDTPPPMWVVDDTGVESIGSPTDGVAEWEGWSFADKNWWSQTASDQGRGQFGLGQGVVAVADPDEWADYGNPIGLGTFDGFMTTPSIDVSGVEAAALRLRFDSSWVPEGNQTAVLTAKYDGGTPVEVLRWETAGVNAKPTATNETVELALTNPVASTVQFEFGLIDAGNNWWWAVDNLKLVEATPLPSIEVNTITGEMTILNAAELTGYEITGPIGSFDEERWAETNLDARNIGSPITADFNNDHIVTLADYTTWRDNIGNSTIGDSDGDGETGVSDYNDWKTQFGAEITEGDSWEVLAGLDDRLSEYFLLGQTSDAALAVGEGYNSVDDLRNLKFYYSTLTEFEIEGTVTYITTAALSSSAVPEPQSCLLLVSILIFGSCLMRYGL